MCPKLGPRVAPWQVVSEFYTHCQGGLYHLGSFSDSCICLGATQILSFLTAKRSPSPLTSALTRAS